jgi:hypothetical protein
MHNNKLLTILKHFSKPDLNQFHKYIVSPYFNKSQQLIHFFEIILKGINSPKPALLEKENVWKKLFKDQKYNDVRFRKLNSDLLKMIGGFLSQQIYDENNMQKSANLIQSAGNRGIKKMYASAIRNYENISEKHPYEDSEFYFNQYLIQKNYFDITQHEFKNSIKHNLEEIDFYLTIFFLTEKLRCYCNVLSQKTSNIKYNIVFSDEILDLARKHKEDIPAIAIYYQIYLTYVESKNENHYFKLKNLLKDYGQKFHSVEARALYDSSLNYCIGRINQGHTHFLQELFELYQDYLIKEAIYVDGELHPFHFKNIVHVSLRLKQYDWTENFINSNNERLPESSRENAVTFNLARLYYYKKNYEKVISLLQEVEYEDIVYSLSSKSLLIATYYESNEIEALYSLFESFRAFLNRRKDLTETKKRNYLNTIKFTKRLVKILPGDKSALEKLKADIEMTKDISDLKWLQEKIAELEK